MTAGVGLGINSTPTLLIGGQTLVGLQSVESLGALIEAEAAKASGTPAESAAP